MKRNSYKKWLAMTLAMAMTFSSSAFTALAAEAPEEAAEAATEANAVEEEAAPEQEPETAAGEAEGAAAGKEAAADESAAPAEALETEGAAAEGEEQADSTEAIDEADVSAQETEADTEETSEDALSETAQGENVTDSADTDGAAVDAANDAAQSTDEEIEAEESSEAALAEDGEKTAYEKEVTAKFAEDLQSVEITGLDDTVQNPVATVKRTEGTGEEAAEIVYADKAEIVDGKAAISTDDAEKKLVTASYSVAIDSDNYNTIEVTFDYEVPFSGYVLMNIPYSVFYGLEGAGVADVDAVSSATNKTGNYGKAGGAYHSGTTTGADGTATGGETGSQVQGVIWPVKADSLDAVAAMGGQVVTDSDRLTVSSVGGGRATSTNLVGYETLVEKPAYSYYELKEEPAYYLTLGSDGSFSAMSGSAESKGAIDVDVTYGTNWGDVQLNLSEASDLSDKLVSGLVLTTSDGTRVGLYHLDQIWSSSDVAWKNDVISELDGKKITNVRYYATVKDGDTADENAPAYANYVYDYAVDIDIAKKFSGELAISFDKTSEIVIEGLPADAENIKAKVYHTTGGRNAVLTYLTPLEVDPADNDIDPVTVDVVDGKIAIVPGSATNNVETKTYGRPIKGTTYTIELSSDNYSFVKQTVECSAYTYAVINIPYSKFYGSESAAVADVDAVSSATDKVGSYTMTGGAFHSGITADESGAAVGKANGAKVQGVIWAVRADSLSEIEALGGSEVTDADIVTVAEAYHGKPTSFKLAGYEALVEKPAYSYYVLSEEPANYMVLADGTFSAVQGAPEQKEAITPTVTLGSNWGDVQMVLDEATDAAANLVSAVVLTADDGTKVGLYHLDQIWRGTQLAWKADVVSGLDGKTITNVRFYCMAKDSDTTDDTAAAYANYVYDYPVNISVPTVSTEAVNAVFNSGAQITVTGIPADAANVKAKVYTGRGNAATYLTPFEVDPADDDIDPVAVSVGSVRGNATARTIAISAGTVTNSAGDSKTYGEPVFGTTYTIELSSDNYILRKTTAAYTANTTDIAGSTYIYTEPAKLGDLTEVSVAGKTYALDKFTAIEGTEIAYYSENPITGTLYGAEPGKVTSYTDLYKSLGVDAKADDYDVISSATNFTGHHAKDIPGIIARDEKGIIGVTLENTSVDAREYVEAAVLKAAGAAITQEQEALLTNVIPYGNPDSDPAVVKEVKLGTVSYSDTCKYGDAEIIINPDDTVEGYVWSNYKNSIYAAVISDGTNKAGAVWWTDLYGESATSGGHYNKIEIALNNGTSKGSNEAVVNRYASMYDTEKAGLKPGKYTVTVYAVGYNDLTAEFEVKAEEPAPKSAQNITVKAAASKVVVGKTTVVTTTGAQGKVSYKSSDASIATVDANGKVTAKKVGKVTITATAAETDTYNAASKTVTISVVPASTSKLAAANLTAGVKLTWKKVTGATKYKVYRGSKLVATVSGTTYTDKSVKSKNGSKYTYKVVATAAAGDSTLAKQVVVYRVTAPKITSVKNTAAKKATVKYKKNAKASGYQIRYSLKKGMSGAKTVKVKGKNKVSKILSSLKKGKTYYVQVRAYKTVSGKTYYSDWSAKKTVKIQK